MNKETLKALKGSIRKWEKIAAGTGKDRGGDNCPLCKLFARGIPTCGGCPVSAASGRSRCVGTPYDAACLEMELSLDKSGRWLGRIAISRAAKAAARRELNFLKSLLPKKATKRGRVR